MGEGFGAKRIEHGAKRLYSLQLLLVEAEKLGQQNVKPAVQAELLTVELADTEIQGFITEAAGWAQSGLKARAAMESPPP